MLTDSRNSLTFTYNLLNLVGEVKSGTTAKARYTWLADGSKLRVRDSGSDGFDYLGSLTYTGSGSGLKLESAQFAGGVIKMTGTSQEVNHFLTDHLGSVRVIVDKNGVVKERNDYYAFGAKHVRPDYPQSDNRYDYNGKEEQTTGNLKYLDYGARMYDATLGRWFNPDPLSEKYYPYSPYNYCLGNPVNFIDVYGLWTEVPDGYTTSDFTDISRFMNFFRGASPFSGFNMNDIDLFMNSEMGTSRGAIYESRFGKHFLEALNVVSRRGEWMADPHSLSRIMTMQKEWAQGLNGTAYNQRFFNPVIANIYQGHSDFWWTTARIAPEGLMLLGDTFTAIGLLSMPTGAGSIPGTGLVTLGSALSNAGELLNFGLDMYEGYTNRAAWGATSFTLKEGIDAVFKYAEKTGSKGSHTSKARLVFKGIFWGLDKMMSKALK